MEEYLHFLLHNKFYPFIWANKEFWILSGFTWCSYWLICRFLWTVLWTIVFLFVLFILAISLSVCLRIMAINNPLDIVGSFPYPWVPCFSNYLGRRFLTNHKITNNEHKWLIDWLIAWLVFNDYYSIIAAISWRWTQIMYLMNPLHIIVNDCCLTPCE